MALSKKAFFYLSVFCAAFGLQALTPFPEGASMASLGALHSDEYTNCQAWEPAVFPLDSQGIGLCLSGVRYYDVMDNSSAFSLGRLSAGIWYAGHNYRIKAAGSFFNAYNIYAEGSGFLSAAYQVLPMLTFSTECQGRAKYLIRETDRMQTLATIGFSAAVTVPFALAWLGVQNITLDNATAVGFAEPLMFQAGVCNRNNRYGSQGILFESSAEPNSIRLSVAEQYWFCTQAGATISLRTNPSLISAGFTVALPTYAAVVALTRHPVLGWSQGIMLAKSFKHN